VLDAQAAGEPVVAVRGTWIGDLIERDGLGVVVEYSNVDLFEEGVRTALRRFVAIAVDTQWAAGATPSSRSPTFSSLIDSREKAGQRYLNLLTSSACDTAKVIEVGDCFRTHRDRAGSRVDAAGEVATLHCFDRFVRHDRLGKGT
jgi:hypothetical protein